MNKVNPFNFKIALFSLLIAVLICGSSPVDFLEEIQNKYDSYNEKYPSVKLNLVFNQPIYSPGDTIFFSAWYHDEEFISIPGDQIITSDLFEEKGRLTERMHFKVRNGRGRNQIILNKDLLPGEYQLVAYSDWMKNFGSAWFYKKNIIVVSGKQIASTEKLNETIQFYPEGGNLIGEISNKVIVLGPKRAELVIQNQYSEITRVVTDSLGIGSFEITPVLSQQYFTVWPKGGTRWVLPDVSADGFSVKLNQQSQGESLKLTVSKHSALLDKDSYAVITSRGRIVMKQKIELKEDYEHTIQLTNGSTALGLHQLFVLNATGEILAQRIFLPITNQEIIVKVETPSVGKQREMIPYKVNVFDSAGNPLESDFSISIIQDNLFHDFSLQNDFDLNDLCAVADRYKNIDSRHSSSLNDFLITQKWERIRWDDIIGNKSPVLTYPFKNTLKFKGKLTSKTTGKAAPDSTLVMGYLQLNMAGYETYTKGGFFQIPFEYDFFGVDQIFCSAQYKLKNMDNDYTISIPIDSTETRRSKHSIETSLPSVYGKYIQAKRLVTNSYSFFGNDQSRRLNSNQNHNANFEEEFMGVDFTVVLSDYVVFSTMKDVIREIIPLAQYREKAEQKSIRLIFKYNERTTIYKGDPLYIIDGVMSRNTLFFLNIKPEDVISIKLINNPNKLAQLGKIGENGVILVETKNANLAKLIQQENHFPLVGLSYPIEFSNFENSTIPTRHPDLRSTIYWNPQLGTDRTGHMENAFKTSDDIGKMRIFIEGLTKTHQYFYSEQLITVEYKATKR